MSDLNTTSPTGYRLPSRQVCKVLPFFTDKGDVPGHEVAAYSFAANDPVDRVVFRDWDEKARMTVEISVHWTEVSEYLRRRWADHGEVVAVLLRSGRRLHAKSWSVGHSDQRAYLDAPILARGVFQITGLGGGHAFWEIVGVSQWIYSARDAEATARHLPCPWERDNRAFRERFPSVAV